MPHSKFNWRSTPAAAAQNSDGTFGFAFGDTWKLTDHTLVKPENAKGCTLDGTSLFFPCALSLILWFLPLSSLLWLLDDGMLDVFVHSLRPFI